MVILRLPWLQVPGFLVLFVLKPWLIFVREYGLSERLIDVSLVVKLLPTLKHVINVNSQTKFHRTMNENESDAQASSFFFSRRRINSDHLHSAAIIRCERAQMYGKPNGSEFAWFSPPCDY